MAQAVVNADIDQLCDALTGLGFDGSRRRYTPGSERSMKRGRAICGRRRAVSQTGAEPRLEAIRVGMFSDLSRKMT